MAVTVTDDRLVITKSDSTTGWTGTSTPAVFTAQPTPVEATGCLGMQVSNATHHAYFTRAAINFTASPGLVYVWIFHRAELDTIANGGITVVLGDGTNRVGFHVAGSDKSGFRHDDGPVGWQCFVIDTAALPAQRTDYAGSFASLNLGAITQFGAGFKTLVKSVGGVENCFWDVIRVSQAGQGLTITGGTIGDPGKFSEIAALDRNTATGRAYGIIRELGSGAYGIQGPITFGSTAPTITTYFSDSNVTLVFADRGLTADKYKITVTGNATGSTTFSLANCTLAAPATGSAQFTASAADLQFLTLTATQFVNFKNGCAFSDSATNAPNHSLTGCAFRGCGILDFKRAVVRGCTFASFVPPVSTDGYVLWNANINIQDCAFVGGGGHGIKHTATGSIDYVGLEFSGYGAIGTTLAAVYNASGGLVTVSVSGGGTTPTYLNGASATTTVVNNLLYTLTGLKTGSEVRAYLDSSGINGTEIDGVESSTTSFSFTVAASTLINIMINHLNYLPADIWQLNTGTADATIPISQSIDRQYNNPV
jgi:hypothetical protein